MSTSGAEAIASVGELIELGRYTVRGSERILFAERVGRFVHITDQPAEEPGGCYFVDSCLASDGDSSLETLVADYTRQARRLKEIPMVASEVKSRVSIRWSSAATASRAACEFSMARGLTASCA